MRLKDLNYFIFLEKSESPKNETPGPIRDTKVLNLIPRKVSFLGLFKNGSEIHRRDVGSSKKRVLNVEV